MGVSCFRAISGMDGVGMGWVWGGYGNLCAGLFYEHRFAMLKSQKVSSISASAASAESAKST